VRLVVLLLLAACGDAPHGSGVARGKLVVALSDAELRRLCEYTVSLGPITGDCGMGEHVTIGKLTVDECIAQNVQRRDIFTSCTATVADVEDCTVDFLPYTPQELCADIIELPASCEVLFTSTCGGL
jgi:hypothetical protein